MKLNDISPQQRQYAISLPEHPDSIALLPPLPSSVELDGVTHLLHEVGFELGAYAAEAGRAANIQACTTLLLCREAAAVGHASYAGLSIESVLAAKFAPPPGLPVPGVLKLPMNFLRALEHSLVLARGPARRPFSVTTFERIHECCADGLIDLGSAGALRTRQTWVRGHSLEVARLVPPPPSYVNACMVDLAAFLSPPDPGGSTMPPVVRIALAAAQLKAVQPFDLVGSDLVMRALIPMASVAYGLPPVLMSRFLNSHGLTLFEAHVEQQLSGDWSFWLGLFLRGFQDSVREARAVLVGLRQAQAAWAAQCAAFRSDSAVHKIVASLVARPAFSIPSLQAAFGISFQSANAAAAALLDAGIVSLVGGARRNRVFIATAVVAVLNDAAASLHDPGGSPDEAAAAPGRAPPLLGVPGGAAAAADAALPSGPPHPRGVPLRDCGP